MWFTVEINNASITLANSNGTISWNSNRTREWIEGYSSMLNPFDDKYLISGSVTGNGVSGNPFSLNITDELLVDLGCLLSSPCIITNGETIFSPNGYSDRIINYGGSLCDCNIEVMINGIAYPLVISN